jgi:hypothetical protein
MSLLGFIRNKILGDDDKNKPQAQLAQQPPKPQAYKPSLREEMQNYARSGKWDNNAAANILNQGLDSGFSWENISQETGVGLDDIRNFSRATRPDYGIKIERPDQSFGNKIVDIFSANTDADKYRRAMKGDAGLTINDFVNNQLTDKTPVGDTVNMFSGEKGPQQVSVQDLSDNFSRMDKATKRAYVSNALAASQRGDFDAKETLRALASKGQLNEDATNISSNPMVNAGRAFTGGIVGGTGAIAQGFAQTPGINTLTPLFLLGNDNPREALKESIDMTRRVGAETRLANASGVGKGINLAGEMAPTVALTALTGPVGKIPFGAVPKAATNLATNIPKALAGSYPVLPKIAPFVPGASSTMALTAGFGQGTGSIYNSLTDMGVENNRARLGAITGGALSAVPTALGIKGILNPVGIAKPVVNKFGSKAMQNGMESLANGEMNAAASFLARRSLQAPVELGVGAANQIGNNIGLNVGGVPTNIFQGVPQAAKENALISMAMGSAGELGSAGGKVLANKAKVVDVNAKKVGGYTNYLDLRKDNKIQELLHLDRQYAKTLDTAYLTPKGRRDIMKAQVALHKEISDRVDELKKGSGTMLGSGPVPNFGRSKYLHAKDALAKSEGQSKVGKVTVKANQSEQVADINAQKALADAPTEAMADLMSEARKYGSAEEFSRQYDTPKYDLINTKNPSIARLAEAARKAKSFEEFANGTYEIPLKDLHGNTPRAANTPGKSRTPNAPVEAYIRQGRGVIDVTDGNHRLYEAADRGEQTIKVRFNDTTKKGDGYWGRLKDFYEEANGRKLDKQQLTDLYNQAHAETPTPQAPKPEAPDPTAALPADVQEVVSAIHDSINKGDYTQAKILKESMGEYAPNIDIPSVAPPKDNSIGSILKERQQVKVQTNKTQELSKRYGVTERTIQTLQKRYGEDNTNNILASTSDATNIRDMNHFVLGEARKRFSNNKGVVVKNNQAPDIQTSPEELASLAKTAPVQETDGTQEKSVKVIYKSPETNTQKKPIAKVVDKSNPVELDKTSERPAEVSGVTGEVRPIHQQIKELPSHENLMAKGAAEVESFNDNFNKHLLEVEKRVGTAKLQKMADDIFNSKNGKLPDPSKIPADSKALYNKEFKQVFEEMAEGRRSAGGTIHEYYFPETIETGGPLVDMGYGLIHKGDVETYGSNIERKGTAKLENLADPITRLRQAKDQFLADKYGGTKEYEIHRTAKAVTERLQRNTQETGETNITKDLGKSKAGDIKINKAINKSAEMIHNLKERIDNQAWDIGAAGFGKRKIINKESGTSIDSANELFSIGKQLGRKQVEINTRSRTSDITVAQKLDDIKVNNESLMRAGGYGQFRDADAFAGTHIKASLNKNGKLNITRLKKDVRKYLTENYKMSKTDVNYLVKSVGDINGKNNKNLPQEILQSKLSSIYQEAARAQMIDLLQTTKFTNKKVNHMVSELTNQILATSKIDSTTANTVVKNVLKTQNTLFRRGNVGSAMNEFSDIPSMLGAFGKDLKIGYDKKMLKVLGVDGHLDPSTEAILQTVTDNKSAQKAFVKLAQKGASGLDFYKYVEALKASTVLKTSQAYWSKKGYKGDALTTKMLHDYRELTLPIDMFTKTALDSVPLYTQYQSWQLRNTQKEFNLARGTLDVGKYTDASRTERIIRNAALNIPAKTAFWLASNGLKGTAIITAFGLTDYTGLTDQDFSGIDDKDKSVWDKTGGKLADLTTTGSLLNSVYQTYEKEKLKKQYENAEYNPYHNNNLASDTLSRFTPQQIKNISGMQETRDKKYSTNRDGKVQYLEATNPLDVARGYVFGKRNTQAGRDYTGNKDVITRVKEGKNPVVAVRDMAKEQLGAQDKIYNRPLNNSDYANYSGKVKELMKKGDTQGAKAMFDGGRAYNHTLDDLMRKDKSAYNHYISSLANDVVPPEKWRERVIRDGKVDYTIYDMLKKREAQRVKDMGGDLNPLYDGKLTKPQLADLLSDKATETGKDIASRNLLWKEKWYQDYKAREKEFYNKNPYADGRALKGRQKDWQDLEDFRNTLSQVRDSKTGKEMAWVKDYPLVAQYKDLNDQYGFDSPEVKSFFKNNYDDYKTQRDTKNAVELATINKMRGIEGHEPMSDSQFAQAKNVVQEDKTAKSNTSSGGGKKYYGSSSSSRGYLSNNFVGTIKGDLGPVAKLKYSSGGKVSIKARATPKVASVKRQKARM